MKVLVLNAGSSSLKYQLIETDDEKVLVKGGIERIGIEGSNLTQKSEKANTRSKNRSPTIRKVSIC